MAILKLYYFLPFFLITGPFLSDLLVSLTSLFFLYYFFKFDKKFILNKFSYFFIIFYFFLLFVALFSVDNFISFKSSIPYFRFFLFGFIIWFCLEKKILNLKVFYLILLSIISIFFLDSLFQYFLGSNIFGQVSPLKYRITSFFGDEAKMGSFIFKIYLLFSFINLLIKIKYQKLIFIIITIFSSILVVISGDRTPFYLLFIYFILISFLTKTKSINFLSIFIFLICSFIFISSNEVIKNRLVKMTYTGFFTTLEKFDQDKIDSSISINIKENKNLKHFISDDHHSHMLSAKKIFLNNFLLGSGPNTFRVECKKKDYFIKENSCSTHPHNFYLQIASETGIIGLILFIFIFFYSSFKILKIIIFGKEDFRLALIYVYIFLIFFPLSPNGNFFNNWLSILNYLPLGFFLYYNNNKNYFFSK